jgi:hypothetical protein
LRIFAVPVVDAKFWLLRRGVFFVADEDELGVVFVPGEALILAFAAEECCGCGVAVGGDGVDAVCVVFVGGY